MFIMFHSNIHCFHPSSCCRTRLLYSLLRKKDREMINFTCQFDKAWCPGSWSNCDTVKVILNGNKHLILRTSSMVWAGLIVHFEVLKESRQLLPACFWSQAGNKSFPLACWPALTFGIVHNYTNEFPFLTVSGVF